MHVCYASACCVVHMVCHISPCMTPAGARSVLDFQKLPQPGGGLPAVPQSDGQHGRALCRGQCRRSGQMRWHLHHLPGGDACWGSQQEAALQPCVPHALPQVQLCCSLVMQSFTGMTSAFGLAISGSSGCACGLVWRCWCQLLRSMQCNSDVSSTHA